LISIFKISYWMKVKRTPFLYSDELVSSLRIDDLSYSWLWGKWLVALAIVSLIQLATMSFAPKLHSDEFMTLELGRIILHPNTDWSIAWLADRGQPVLIWYYLGPFLQEFSLQIIGQYGPRVSGLIGALIAATAIVGWLLTKGTSRSAALLLGLVFLLDPLFVQSYTIGRVDSWTMALCIISCWILRDTANKLSYKCRFNGRVMVASALSTIAFFTWPSAVFMFPLILLELIYLASKYGSIDGNWKKTTPFVLFGISSLLIALLIIIPIAPQLYAQMSNVVDGLTTNTHSGPAGGQSSIFSNSIELLRVFKFSPALLLIALLSILIKRELGLALAELVAVILMLCTLVYVNRVQYLLPYFIVAVAGIYHRGSKHSGNETSVLHLLKSGALIMLLTWSIGLSICFRSILAFDYRATTDRNMVYQAAQSMIGAGNHSVYIPYEFYYPGRSLGWKMYRAYLAVGDPLSPEVLGQILPHVDYVIMYQWEVKETFEQRLKEVGMLDRGTYYLYGDSIEIDDGKTTNIKRLRNLYSIFPRPYGPYKLYARKSKLATVSHSQRNETD
jgi:hypothetical protein